MQTPLTRRALVSGAPFMILAPHLVRGSQVNSQVTVGLIGAGNRGTYDARVIQSDGRARVTALADPYEDQLDRAATALKLEKPKLYKDHEKLLADSGVDAVIIATPPFLHPPHLEAAVQAQKHIYCEKPMGVDAEGCKRVIAAARKLDKSKNLSVGFQQRYGGVYLEAYNRIQAGAIGTMVNARGFWIGSDPFQRRPFEDPKVEKIRNWFAYKDYSGDFIVEQDCHNFDVLHWFLGGLPEAAVGMGGTKVRTSMDLMDHLSLSFRFPNNIHVNFEANQLTPRGWSRVGEEFTGTTGVIETSRSKMVQTKGPKPEEKETIQSPRDITYDAFKLFIDRIQAGQAENVGERSAQSTLFAILGRTAIYQRREATWKGEFGNL
jgi:predicted dehydrogenase